MWADMLNMGIPALEKILRTVLVYGGLAVLLRLGGKRDLAQLNSFDLVVMLLLSNVVQNAVIGNDNSLTGGLLGAVVLILLNSGVVRWVNRYPRLISLFEGTPTVLVRDGKLDHKALHQLGLRQADVAAALRRQGAADLHEVEQATLDAGGSIVVTLKEEAQDVTRMDLQASHEALLAELRSELAAMEARLTAASAGNAQTS